MARESVFDVDLGLDDAVKQLERSRDLVREISEANSKNLDVTDKVKNQYKEINDSLTKQRLEIARMSADFAEQLKAMQVSGLSQDEINAAKQKFQNEKDIAKLAEESLAKQRQALSDKSRIELLNEDKLHRKRILHFKEISKLAGGLWDIAKYATGTAIGVAATGALGGVAFGTMASSGGEERKRAMGLGVSVPEMQALRHVYKSIYDDPEATLSKLYGLQRDPSGATKLSQIFRGIDKRFDTPSEIGRASTFDLATAMPTAVKQRLDYIDQKYAKGNEFLRSSYYPMFGLDVLGQSDIARIGHKNMTYEELKTKEGRLPDALQRESLADSTSKRWQDLLEKVGLSGQAIENTFLNTLEKLTPQLGKLSEGITDVIKVVGKSPVVATAIDKTANALGRFTKYLSPEGEATKDVTGFLETLDVVAGDIYSLFDGLSDKARSIGLIDEVSLKGSDYRKLSAIGGIDSDFAKLLKEEEENPSNANDYNRAVKAWLSLPKDKQDKIKSLAGGMGAGVLGATSYETPWGREKLAEIGSNAAMSVADVVDIAKEREKRRSGLSHVLDLPDLLPKANGMRLPHSDIGELNAKKGAFAGGHTKQSTIDVMGVIQGLKGFNRHTAANDDFKHSATGGHSEGRAFDFTIKNDSKAGYAAAAIAVRDLLAKHGIIADLNKKSGIASHAYILDEKNHPQDKTTAPHIHIALPKEFDKLTAITQRAMKDGSVKAFPATAQPKPRPQEFECKVKVDAGHGMDATAQMQRCR